MRSAFVIRLDITSCRPIVKSNSGNLYNEYYVEYCL